MTDNLRILIIEDDPDVALGCEQALQLEGFTAEVAGSAEQNACDQPFIIYCPVLHMRYFPRYHPFWQQAQCSRPRRHNKHHP